MVKLFFSVFGQTPKHVFLSVFGGFVLFLPSRWVWDGRRFLLASSSPSCLALFPAPEVFRRWLAFLLVLGVFPSPSFRPPFLNIRLHKTTTITIDYLLLKVLYELVRH